MDKVLEQLAELRAEVQSLRDAIEYLIDALAAEVADGDGAQPLMDLDGNVIGSDDA